MYMYLHNSTKHLKITIMYYYSTIIYITGKAISCFMLLNLPKGSEKKCQAGSKHVDNIPN